MNRHPTEQQLIDYQFKLAAEPAMSEIAGHLERCGNCRRRLDALTRKFAALDLLRGDVSVSDALLARTVEATTATHRPRVLSLYRMPWLGAVAASVVVGFALLLVSTQWPQDRPANTPSPDISEPVQVPAEVAEGPSAEEPGQRGRAEAATRARGGPASETADRPKGSLAVQRPDDSQAKVESYALATPSRPRSTAAPAEPLPETPPFAPASAIELVILPRRENVQLTIYNGADLTLVRERRNLTLKRGWNWLQFMWADTRIDPTSLSLEPAQHADRVEVQQLVFPPRLRELGRWLIRSEIGGQVPFELTYLTSGLSWRAFYMGTLSQDETTMRLEAYVRVDNGSGEDYDDAQTRLVVGKVHILDRIAELARREHAYGRPEPLDDLERVDYYYSRQLSTLRRNLQEEAEDLSFGLGLDARKRKEIRKEGLSEYFLYTIEGTETIPDRWGKRLLSFEADDIPVSSLYKYDEQRWGRQAVRFLSFANDEEHELGETPLPDGTVRIYGRADERGHLTYVGGMDVKYIPVGEEVELNLGPARLVDVEPVLTGVRTENLTFDPDGDITGWDEVQTWRIDVTNARPLPIAVEITRGFDTPYWTLESHDVEVAYEKHDATHARFRLSLQPQSRQALEYVVTTRHGVREQTLTQDGSNGMD